MHAAFGITFSVFFIIGVCTYFLGCNTDLENQCFAYNVVHGVAYGYKFTSRTCSECIARNSKGGCTAYRHYECYSAYVKFHHGGGNETCYYSTCSDSESEKSAQNSVNSHPIGDTMTLLEQKGTSQCLDVSTGMDTWIAGATFLSLTALVAFLWLTYAASRWINKPQRTVLPVAAVVEIF